VLASGLDQASVHVLRSWRISLPVIDLEPTVSGAVAALSSALAARAERYGPRG
jgi:hypothetical protein